MSVADDVRFAEALIRVKTRHALDPELEEFTAEARRRKPIRRLACNGRDRVAQQDAGVYL